VRPAHPASADRPITATDEPALVNAGAIGPRGEV
jgi:hypothetical protein